MHGAVPGAGTGSAHLTFPTTAVDRSMCRSIDVERVNQVKLVPLMRSLAATAALLAASACSTFSVSSDHDTSVDFSGYRTWSWAAHATPAQGNGAAPGSLADRRIRAAVAAEFTRRGFPEAGEGSADFQVRYRAAAMLRQQVTAFHSGYRNWWGWGSGHTDVIVTDYVEGTLTLDVLSPGSEEIQWTGSAQGVLDDTLTPQEREARITEAVAAILDRFPPRGP